MSRMFCAARFSIKATSTRLVPPVSDQRPQPRSSARTHNDVNYGAHQPQALSCASSFQSTNLFLARCQHKCIMHSDWEKMKRKAKPFHLFSLPLSHTLCHAVLSPFKLSCHFQPQLFLFLSWKSAGSVQALSSSRIACISLPVDLIIFAQTWQSTHIYNTVLCAARI